MASTMMVGLVLPVGISAGLMALPGFPRTDSLPPKIELEWNRLNFGFVVSVRRR